jgi:hypothetical protein
MSLDRVLLTLATFAFAGGCYLLMLKGWRSRQRRQADLPAPPAPPAVAAPAVLAPVSGVYVGTTSAADWLDRIAVHGLSDRSTARLTVATDGVHVDRAPLPELYLPYAAVEQVALGDALAGKVMGRDGLVLLTWRLGERSLTSGFRADDHADHARLVDAVSAQLSRATAGGHHKEAS